MISSEVLGSRFPVGSSASITFGALSKALAMATRCCSPPDISKVLLCRLFCIPTRESTSMILSDRFALSFHPVARNTKSRLASTLRSLSS